MERWARAGDLTRPYKNYDERIRNHLKTKRFKKLMKEYGKRSIISKKLSKYIFSEDAAVKEHRLIIKY